MTTDVEEILLNLMQKMDAKLDRMFSKIGSHESRIAVLENDVKRKQTRDNIPVPKERAIISITTKQLAKIIGLLVGGAGSGGLIALFFQ